MKKHIYFTLLTVAASLNAQDNYFAPDRILHAFEQGPAIPNEPYSICVVVKEADADNNKPELACLDITNGLDLDKLETPEKKFLAGYILETMKKYEGNKPFFDEFAEVLNEIFEAVTSDDGDQIPEPTIVKIESPELKEHHYLTLQELLNKTQES